MKTHFDYKRTINWYIDELNKHCKDGVHYETDYNPVYGGWRLNKYYNDSSAIQVSTISNYDRMPSRYFAQYLQGICTTIRNADWLFSKPF